MKANVRWGRFILLLMAVNIIVIGLWMLGAKSANASEFDPNASEDAVEFVIDANLLYVTQTQLRVDPNLYRIFIEPPPSPKWKCTIHGVIDHDKLGVFTIYDVDTVREYCIRCFIDLLDKNIPELVKIDNNNQGESK